MGILILKSHYYYISLALAKHDKCLSSDHLENEIEQRHLHFFFCACFAPPTPSSFLKSNIAILNRKARTDLYPKCAINPGSKMRDKYSKLTIMSYTSKPKKRKKWGGGGKEIQSFSGSFGPYFSNLFEQNPRLFQRWAEQGHLQPPSGSCDCKGAFYLFFFGPFYFFLRLPPHPAPSPPQRGRPLALSGAAAPPTGRPLPPQLLPKTAASPLIPIAGGYKQPNIASARNTADITGSSVRMKLQVLLYAVFSFFFFFLNRPLSVGTSTLSLE